ncbi:MAG: hypothetical protein AB7U38_14580, partial [Hyphomicrobiales bacterium]
MPALTSWRAATPLEDARATGRRGATGVGGAMSDRGWVHEAIERIEADFARSADTHLIRVELPAHPGI